MDWLFCLSEKQPYIPICIIHPKVPVKVITTLTCDKPTTTDDNTMVLTSTGALVTQANQLTIEYGNSQPAYPDDVLPQADATCGSNPLCALNGIKTGNCCPQDNGVYNQCEMMYEGSVVCMRGRAKCGYPSLYII